MSETITTSPAPAAGPDQPNARYWREMDGATYEELLRERESNDNRSYQQQESFLRAFFGRESALLQRPVSILEFGCGFGRHARYLARDPMVRYHGYDFSERMLAPLRERPPVGLSPVDERIFGGAAVGEAVAGRTFDVVFTVSVMIHNTPETVAGLLGEIARVLRPGGSICLVENKLVPVSVYENDWHDGCWLHCYPDLIPAGFDMHLAQNLERHDVYVLRSNGGGPPRFFELASDGQPAREMNRMELDARSVPKIRSWARAMGAEKQKLARGGDARLGELEEMLRAERRLESRRRRLSAIPDELASLRARIAAEKRAQEPPPPDPAAPPLREAAIWNDPTDTHWAPADARFARVLHVFHQEWHGIRASAGYTPGEKLAITSRRLLAAHEQQSVVRGCADRLIRAVVFHGYSSTADELVETLYGALGDSLRIYVVFLGSTAQLHLDFERDSFARILQRREQGLLAGVGCFKADMHLISNRIFPKTLLSLPPTVEDVPSLRDALTGRAFIPVPNDWRKNFYTALLAAQGASRLSEIVATTSFRELPGTARCRVIRIEPPPRAQVFRIMRESDVILNVSLTECQPMVALEGAVLGTPCLTGPLALGDLDSHPYQRLAQVAAVDSVRAVREAIDRILDVRERSPADLRDMMADYAATVRGRALQLYGEFLQP